MLKYLIILLSDDAVSYCHYPQKSDAVSISAATLSRAILWAMKENLSIQFVHSQNVVSTEINKLMNSIDHIDIVPSNSLSHELKVAADIIVVNEWEHIGGSKCEPKQALVIRTTFEKLLDNNAKLTILLKPADRVNVVITNVNSVSDEKMGKYLEFLEDIIPTIVAEYKRGHQVQLNILTDRLMLKEMNNCNAGDESITLAPDGKFYLCPAFYFNGSKSVGSLDFGLEIKNAQLYKLSHAPICRICDAFHCKRCIYLNKQMCGEVNTPSHQQCIMAHIERKASQILLNAFREIDPTFLNDVGISDIDYIDPFDKIEKKN